MIDICKCCHIHLKNVSEQPVETTETLLCMLDNNVNKFYYMT